jgi:hypothetical protein
VCEHLGGAFHQLKMKHAFDTRAKSFPVLWIQAGVEAAWDP